MDMIIYIYIYAHKMLHFWTLSFSLPLRWGMEGHFIVLDSFNIARVLEFGGWGEGKGGNGKQNDAFRCHLLGHVCGKLI